MSDHHLDRHIADLLDCDRGAPSSLLEVARALVRDKPDATLDDIIRAMRRHVSARPAAYARAARILGSGYHQLHAADRTRPSGPSA